ncbi:MAG TPA: ribonuclease D [Myxococcaceae bacterium]|nr:ribonuclease D [Myxococcaceae bacterium]
MTFPQVATDVATPEATVEAVRSLEGSGELAVDVEADAMHAFRASLCFVQVATDRALFLFDTLAAGVEAKALVPLLSNASSTKYFHAAGGDLQYLAEAGVRVRGLFDTHRAATLLGWQKVGLADLARERLQVELAKEHQQSDFAMRPLPPEVRAYIADDVRYLCEIGRQVKEECRKADILEEVLLDCERLCAEAEARPDLSEFKPRLPRGSMSATQYALGMAIGALLHEKRLGWAEAANVPMGRMLSNAAVTAIAQRAPTTLKELSRLEGVRGAFTREHGEEVLELVRILVELQRAGTLQPQEEKKGRRDPNKKKREDALKAWRAEKAAERKVTPSVVLPNALVEDLSRLGSPGAKEIGAVPWFGEKRERLYAADLAELLAKFPPT